MNAEDNLMLFYPERMQGETAYHHPFWDEIRNAAVKVKTDFDEDLVIASLTRKCDELYDGDQWRLAGRTSSLKKVAKSGYTALMADHVIPKDAVARPASLSYSQIKTMLGCPMKWFLQYQTDLKAPNTLSIPTGNTMIGTFCHRIVQELFSDPDQQWTPDAAANRANELYGSLIISMASELLLDGNELENMRYKASIVNAVKKLVGTISHYGLAVEKSEENLEGNLDGIPFTGIADLLLRDGEGNSFILDLKWTSTSRYKKEEFEEGSALQLATYTWLLRSANPDSNIHSGYFMLAQGEMLSDSDLLNEESLSAEISLEEVWDIGVKTWNQRLAILNSGRMKAGGVHEQMIRVEEGFDDKKVREHLKKEMQSQGLLYQRPQCIFCDFSSLCGMAGGVK